MHSYKANSSKVDVVLIMSPRILPELCPGRLCVYHHATLSPQISVCALKSVICISTMEQYLPCFRTGGLQKKKGWRGGEEA